MMLSVLIPTYNRVKFLETVVSQFLAQVEEGGFGGRVEIIVGNDASPDTTADYLNALDTTQYPFVRVLNHPKNLGVSGNFEALVAAARGEYIWFFGDDDLMCEGALKKVVQSIDTKKPNYILINTKNILSLDDRNVEYTIVGEKRLSITEDVFIKDYASEKDRLSKIDNWLYLTGLLSAVACKKQLFIDWMDEAKKYMRPENVYLYQAPIVMGIAEVGSLAIIAAPLVLHRKNENNWTDSLAKILRVNLYDAYEILRVIRKYMPREYRNHQKRFAAFVLASLLKAKKEGIGTTIYLFDVLKRNYNCYPYNLRFLIVLVTPWVLLKRFK